MTLCPQVLQILQMRDPNGDPLPATRPRQRRRALDVDCERARDQEAEGKQVSVGSSWRQLGQDRIRRPKLDHLIAVEEVGVPPPLATGPQLLARLGIYALPSNQKRNMGQLGGGAL